VAILKMEAPALYPQLWLGQPKPHPHVIALPTRVTRSGSSEHRKKQCSIILALLDAGGAHCSGNELFVLAKPKVWKGLPMAKVK
jgi:hypothetical protein